MIVIIADSDPRKKVMGGIGVYSSSLANHLSKKHDVLFVGKCQSDSIINKLNYDVQIANKKPNQINPLFFKSLFCFPKKNLKSSIIHAQRPDWIIPFRNCDAKKIITLHGSHYKNIKMKKGKLAAFTYGILERYSFKIADTVVAVDHKTQEEYIKKYPFAKDKIVFVPVAIDTKKFIPLPKAKLLKELGLTAKKKIFLFVGRLSKEKRVELMINNLKEGETLIIAGSGDLESGLKELSKGKDVIFLGPKGADDLVKYYNVADALLLFSTHEGLPTVALEAFSCGTPVISTRVGEMPLLIKKGKTGYLVDNDNYRKAMDSHLTNDMAKECLTLALNYDWKNIVKKLEKEVYS